ncbi:HAD family hydrolase [Streptomyces sp. B8F3]|uniref:HAD family hydrolase n=1 Tax=unclassified Streptomyces TaxID=2593676 RepID=UPI00325E35AE
MPRAALFDVDGTLVDSTYLHVTAWWEALRQSGHDVPTAVIHHAIGLGSTDLLDHLLGEHRDRDQDDTISKAHKTLYATHYETLTPLPGAGDLLRALDARGWRIGLVTSADDRQLTAMREAIGADDVIRDTASSTDVTHGKPAPDPLRHAMELVGSDTNGTVFVGDSVWDMQAASRAGITAVALLSGGIPRAHLEHAGAHETYEDPSDLLAHLDDSAFGTCFMAGPASSPVDWPAGPGAGDPS